MSTKHKGVGSNPTGRLGKKEDINGSLDRNEVFVYLIEIFRR